MMSRSKIISDGCSSNPCENGGECTEGKPGTYSCSCPPEYRGTNCELELGSGKLACTLLKNAVNTKREENKWWHL